MDEWRKKNEIILSSLQYYSNYSLNEFVKLLPKSELAYTLAADRN